MSKTITGATSTFVSPITIPTPGDDANADDLEIALQALADREGYLQNVVESTGVPRIRGAADVAAVKAITVSGVATGDLRIVPGVGIYRYDSTSSASEDSPWVLQPNAGSGRWIHILADYAPRNRIIEVEYVYDLLGYSNATTGYVSVISLNHTAVAGDIMVIDWSAVFSSVGSGGSYSRLTITDGGVDTDIAITRRLHTAANDCHSGLYKHTVGTSGTVYARLKAASITSGTTATDSAGAMTGVPQLRSTLIRP